MERKKPIIIKSYKGDEIKSRREFERDAEIMQVHGYYPISQNYTPGSYGGADFLVAALLVIILIGILVFIYMLIVKPDGTLSVTYELREKDEEKKCPMCAEKVKYEAIICKHCGHKFDPNVEVIKIQDNFETIDNVQKITEKERVKKIKRKNIIIIIIIIIIIVSALIGPTIIDQYNQSIEQEIYGNEN